MKKTNWSIFAGVIGIILGLLGILGGAYNIMMPQLLEVQKQKYKSLQEQFEGEIYFYSPKSPEQAQKILTATANQRDLQDGLKKLLKNQQGPENQERLKQAQKAVAYGQEMYKKHDLPNWIKSWLVVSGMAGLIISFSYIFFSASILKLKNSAIKSLFIVVGLMLILNLADALLGWYLLPKLWPLGFTKLNLGLVAAFVNLSFLAMISRCKKQVLS